MTIVLLLLAMVASAGGGAATPPSAAPADVDPDTVVLEIHLQPDGAATVTVEYRIRLDDENATEAFESVRQDIRNNETEFTERFADRMRRTVASAENSTGRTMSVRNVSVATSRQQFGREYGIVTYRFVWTGFAVVDGRELTAGDALSGLFLDERTSLRFTWPDEYRTVSVAPASDESNDVIWHGQRNFDAGEPRLALTSAPASTESTTDGRASTDSAGDSPVSARSVAATLVALVALGGGVYLAFHRKNAGGSVRTESDADVATDDPTTNGRGASAGVPEDLLTPEERVMRFVAERGGRVEQQTVTDEFGWSSARTSQLVGELREDEKLEVLRIGRNNVLSLPED